MLLYGAGYGARTRCPDLYQRITLAQAACLINLVGPKIRKWVCLSDQQPYGYDPRDPFKVDILLSNLEAIIPQQVDLTQQPEGYYPPQGAYPQLQQYGYPGVPIAQPETGGGFAIAGLILGIISIPIALFALCGYIAAILGIIFSLLGRRAPEAHHGDHWPRALDSWLRCLHYQLCRWCNADVSSALTPAHPHKSPGAQGSSRPGLYVGAVWLLGAVEGGNGSGTSKI